MRFYKTRRLRIISVASLLLVLTGLPLVLGLTRPAGDVAGETPGLVLAYASGLSSLGLAGLVSLILAVVFGLCVLAGRRRAVGLVYLGVNARNHHNLVETGRMLAIVVGAAGLIVGSLAGLYAAMIHARPDLYTQLPLPFLTAELAFGSLFGGGALYALGRIGRA